MSVALVTGASRGIGEQISRALARSGHELILVARGQPALEALASELRRTHSVRVHAWAEDLSDLHAPARIERKLAESGLKLHLLVNNAGVGSTGAFLDGDVNAEAGMILLNVYALTTLTRLLLPHLVASQRGGILNVASTAALQPVPWMATYAATKAYVLSFSQALGNEVADLGITVTALCPGPTRTDFVKLAGAERRRLFDPSQLARAEDVAKAGLAGLLRRRAVVIHGLKNQLLAFGARFVPRSMLVRISRKLLTQIGA